MKASVLLDVIDGAGVGLLGAAPSHVAVQHSFWFGGAGGGHINLSLCQYFGWKVPVQAEDQLVWDLSYLST